MQRQTTWTQLSQRLKQGNLLVGQSLPADKIYILSSEQRRKESRKTSHYDVNTILEELDELATRRDSSPPNSPQLLTTRRPPQLPRTARELIQRRKSLLVHLSDWYSDLCWPYDEDETILGLRYAISGILATTAFAILCSTFFGWNFHQRAIAPSVIPPVIQEADRPPSTSQNAIVFFCP